MSQYLSLLTRIGGQRLAATSATGTPLIIREMAIGDGDGQPVTVTDTRTALVNEVQRVQVSALYQDPENPGWFVVEGLIPAHLGGWTIREIGLYDDNGHLLAYGNLPPSYKPIITEGAAREMLIRMVVAFGSAANVQMTIDPNVVLATQAWVRMQLKARHFLSRPRRFFLSQI